MKVEVILGSGLTAGQVEELGLIAEEVGIHRLWVQSFPGRRDPLLTIAGLARLTRRIGLGVLPTSPYEVHPLRIADSLLTLNDMSGGRASILIGGLGHSVMRVTGLTPARRLTAVGDTVRILKGIRPDLALNYQGGMYSLLDYQPDWATAPPPEIYVGSTGPKMLAMAAGVADGVMMSDVPLVRMPEVMGHIRSGLATANRPADSFGVNNFVAWHIGADREAAMREARQELVWRGLLQRWHTAGFLDTDEADFVEANWNAFLQAFLQRTPRIEGVPDAIVEKLIANLTFAGGLGDIDRVADELRRYEQAGGNEVALRVHDNPSSAIRIIGERLIPALG